MLGCISPGIKQTIVLMFLFFLLKRPKFINLRNFVSAFLRFLACFCSICYDLPRLGMLNKCAWMRRNFYEKHAQKGNRADSLRSADPLAGRARRSGRKFQRGGGLVRRRNRDRPSPQQGWQAQVTFPDWAGYVDDTLAVNSLYSFDGYADQGELYVTLASGVTSLRLFVNNAEVDTSAMKGGSTYKVDISDLTVNGTNTVHVSAITPSTLEGTVTVSIPYPTVITGLPSDVGMDEGVLGIIDDFIASEVHYTGFAFYSHIYLKANNEVWKPFSAPNLVVFSAVLQRALLTCFPCSPVPLLH